MADTRDADADEAYENDFSLGDNWVPTRFLLLELMGTYFYTLISAGIVISSGIFTYQFTTNEMNPSRHIAIALANAFVRHAIRVAGRGGGAYRVWKGGGVAPVRFPLALSLAGSCRRASVYPSVMFACLGVRVRVCASRMLRPLLRLMNSHIMRCPEECNDDETSVY